MADAQNIKIRDHNLNELFSTPLTPTCWNNFAVVVDWDNLTLAVFHSVGSQPLELVSPTATNQGAVAGSNGQGEFHFGVLKVRSFLPAKVFQLLRPRKQLPLVNPLDSSAEQNDVVHHGIQEGTTEGLLYSGIFIEKVAPGGPTLSGPL